MVELFCMVVGEKGSAFPVDISTSQSVDHLKDAIKVKKENDLKAVDADKLQLFLAKNGDAWLESSSDDVKKLKQGQKTATIQELTEEDKELQGEDDLEGVLFGMPAPKAKQIHVLVVIPEGAGGSPTKIVKWSANDLFEAEDSSDDWLSKFHSKRIEYHSLPSIASLPDFIEQPLPVKIRMKTKVLLAWSFLPNGPNSDLRDKLFVADDGAPCKKIKRKIRNMLEPLSTGNSESSFHGFWDTVFSAVLHLVFGRARMDRDSSMNSSSTGNQRPDFMFVLNDICVFRGEEKGPGISIRLPREELCQKLAWVYGTVPYIFGYAASGHKIDLFALFRSSSDSTKAESYRIGEFDFGIATDLFRIVLALMNMCLLFPAITEACPDSGRDEFKSIYRSNGIIVHLNPTFVEKVFPSDEGFDQLQHIYRIMKVADVPNVDHLIKLKLTKKTAKFEPRGMMVKPHNLLELFGALRNVLEALVVLHRESVMHRDIRWSNVIKRRDCDKWFLIDFADAATSPQRFPNGKHLSTEEHAPEIFVSGSTHTVAVDIWAVGYLIETSGVNWDDLSQRTAFVKRLMLKDPTARPTAEEALRDLGELQAAVMQDQLLADTLSQTRIQACNESKRRIEHEKRTRASKRNKNKR